MGVVVVGLVISAAFVLGQATKKKEANALNDKVQQLMDSTAKRSVLRLNGNKFRDYVRPDQIFPCRVF